MKIRITLLVAVLLAAFTGPAFAATETAAAAVVKKIPGDADKNGLLSKAEYITVQEKRFNEMDANHDGTVSFDEKQVFDEKMRDKRNEGKTFIDRILN